MQNYLENLARHRRLSILILLADAGSANESLLFDCLEDLGLEAALTRDAVRGDLKWLQERDLVQLEMVDDTLMVVRITRRGIDCAKGRIIVEGVKKPSLGVV